MTTQILVQYNIPRYILGKPGKQNRACTGEMTIVPGLTHPFEFIYSNTDGVPINLAGFTLRLLFWYPVSDYELLPASFDQGIVLAKDLEVADPYCATATVLLTDQDTQLLGSGKRATLRWSVYMIDNDSDNVFATQITPDGGPWGICHFDRCDMPNAETIKGVTVSR